MSSYPFPSLVDISIPLGVRTPVYPGDTPFRREVLSHLDDGAAATVSALTMSAHSGTHVDAPAHFVRGGATIDEIAPERWVSEAVVVDCSDARSIEPRHLEGLSLREGLSVLFKTRNAELLDAGVVTDEFCDLDREAAVILAEAHVNCVGIDYLSIERPGDGTYPVHRTLLGAGVLVVENVDLRTVVAGEYLLFLAPLRIERSDGAPARAFLLGDPAADISTRYLIRKG
ncbi:MAG: cyclase family protein [Bacteroidota bacterium]|nr:cyclase family protein [Bacteroidota bacterium]